MIKTRQLRKEDRVHIEALMKQLADKAIEGEVESLVENENFFPLVIEDDGKVVGFGSMSVYHSLIKGRTGVLEDVIVDVEYRGKGLGRKIIQELINIARDREIKVLTLTSNPKRVPARKLYQSEGFELRDTGFFTKEL